MSQQNHAGDEDLLRTRFSSASHPSFHSPVLQQDVADVLRNTNNVPQRAVSSFYLNPSAAQSFVSEDPESSYTFTPSRTRREHTSMSQERLSEGQIEDDERSQPRHVPNHDPLPSLRGLSIRESNRRTINGRDASTSASLNTLADPQFAAMLPIREDGVLVIGYSHTNLGRKHNATWYFRGLTISQAERLLAARGLQDMIQGCPSGGTGDAQSSRHTPSFSTQPASNGFYAAPFHGLNESPTGNDSDARTDVAERQAMLEPLRYFACPFSKHDPERYMYVRGPCTIAPGFTEFRRVKEHVKKYHAPPSACPTCKVSWNTAGSKDWNKEHAVKAFHEHQSACQKRPPAGIMAHPEWLDVEQTQRVDHSDFRGKSTTEEKWKQLYKNYLFPDPPGIDAPSPYYDYYVPSHRIMAASNRSFDFTQINAPFYPVVPTQGTNSVPNGSLIDAANPSFLENSSGRVGNARESVPNGTINVPHGAARHSDSGRRARQHRHQDSGYGGLPLDGFEHREANNPRSDSFPRNDDLQGHTFGIQEGGYMDMGNGVPFYDIIDGPAGFVDLIRQELQPDHIQMAQNDRTTMWNGVQMGSDRQCMCRRPTCNYCWLEGETEM